MERISDHRSNMGNRVSFLRRQKHAPIIQRSISTLTQKDLFLLDNKKQRNPKQETQLIYNQKRTTVDSSLKPPLFQTNNCFPNSIILFYPKWLTTLKLLLSKPNLSTLSLRENCFCPQSLPPFPLSSLKHLSSRSLFLKDRSMRKPLPPFTTKSLWTLCPIEHLQKIN